MPPPSERSVRQQIEDYSSFRRRIEVFSGEEQDALDWAYQIAKSAHRSQVRQSGERYFEHPRAVFNILFDECAVRDSGILIIALLHDVCEDTAIFGNPTKMPYSLWQEKARKRLAMNFGNTVANDVLSLAEPTVEGIEITSKNKSEEIYHVKLKSASSRALVVKMADRLHNLRTLKAVSAEKRINKIKETEDIYLPLFASSSMEFPETRDILLSNIQKVITELKSS